MATEIEEIQKEKIKAELSKLIAEEEKVREEIKVLRKPALLNPSAWVPLLIALVSLSGTTIKWYQAEQAKIFANQSEEQAVVAKNKAVLEEKATSAYAKNLEKADKPAGVKLPTAKIKFKGSITREQITGLQLILNQENYTSPRPFRTSSVEATEILYFDSSDKEVANLLSKKVITYFEVLDCPLKSGLHYRYMKSEKYKKGTIVISIHHKCG